MRTPGKQTVQSRDQARFPRYVAAETRSVKHLLD